MARKAAAKSDAEIEQDRLTEALHRYRVSTSATANQRKRERDDLNFRIPDAEHQWDAAQRASRSAQIVAGQSVPPRPMLCVSTMDEPIELVENQQKSARLGVNIHPLTEDASDDTADVLQGLYRAIERNSRASLARTWAFNRACEAGRGCYRIDNEYDPAATVPGDQRIVIRRILFQEAAHFDPWAKEPDWSDATFAFVVERMPYASFVREFGDDAIGMDSDGDFADAVEQWPDWFEDGDDGRIVTVAEYFYVEDERALTDIANAPGEARKVPDPTKSRRRVYCRKMTGAGFLEPPQRKPGEYIPLVQVIGKELQPVDGERHFLGMIASAKDGAKLTNMAASNAVQMAALEPLAPWIMAEGQDEGHKTEWALANTVPLNLKYKQLDAFGMPAPPPQRVQVDMSRLGPSMQLLQMGQGFVRSATATYGDALGEKQSAHRSGRAVMALQDQTTEATSGYLEQLSIAMTYEAMVILSMIPEIFDRPERVVTILDENDQPSLVMLNAPHIIHAHTKRPILAPVQPNTDPSVVSDDSTNPVKHYDLNKGRYGVSVTIGKSSQSRLMAGNDALSQLLQAEPALFQIIGPEWMRFQDYPGAKTIEALLRKNREHTMPWLSDDPNAQAAARLAQMQQILPQLQALADKGKVELQKVQMQEQAESARAAASDDVQLKKAEIAATASMANAQAKVDAENFRSYVDAMETRLAHSLNLHMHRTEQLHEMVAQLVGQHHEAQQAHADRRHEAAMSGADHASAMAQIDAQPEPATAGVSDAS